MPIRPENRSRYPANWKEISAAIRMRAGNVCEWCGARNGAPHPITGSKVILTTAHLDHQPEHNDSANLRALCQKCHNTYDAPMRRAGIKQRQRAAQAAGDLFFSGGDMSDQQPSLPEDWADRDSHDGFFEYIELCRKEAREGKPLPAMFRPREAAE